MNLGRIIKSLVGRHARLRCPKVAVVPAGA